MDDGHLIELVSAFPQLYVKYEYLYELEILKEKAWKYIGTILEETAEACEHRWEILRNEYTGLRREFSKQPPSDSEASKISWPYFEFMSFLDPHLQTTGSTGSFSNLSLKKAMVNEWDSENEGVDSEHTCSSHRNMSQAPVRSPQELHTAQQRKRKYAATIIPQHTLLPSKIVKTDGKSQEVSGTNITKQLTPTMDDDHFIRSLVYYLSIFSPEEKIIIKRKIYDVIRDFLQSLHEE